MFDWLGRFLDALTNVIPRLIKVRDCEKLIIWDWRGKQRMKQPGIRLFWPLVMSMEMVDLRYRSTMTYAQGITLADGTTVTARVLLAWRSRAPMKMVALNMDYEDRVAELCQAMAVAVLSTKVEFTLRNIPGLNDLLTETAREEFRKIGIYVHECRFTELVVSPAYRIINDQQ